MKAILFTLLSLLTALSLLDYWIQVTREPAHDPDMLRDAAKLIRTENRLWRYLDGLQDRDAPRWSERHEYD